MKCWVQSIQMRRSRALINPALLAPDGRSGEVRQWRDLSFLLRLCPFFVCDSLGACSWRRTILTSRHLVVLFHLIVFILFRSFASFSRSFFHRIVISFLSLRFAFSSLYFSHACSSEGYSSLPDFQRAFRFLAWFPCFSISEVSIRIKVSFLFYFPTFSHKGPHSEDNPRGQDQKMHRLGH